MTWVPAFAVVGVVIVATLLLSYTIQRATRHLEVAIANVAAGLAERADRLTEEVAALRAAMPSRWPSPQHQER